MASMARLPFDPKKSAGPPAPPESRADVPEKKRGRAAKTSAGAGKRYAHAAEAKQLTVSQVSLLIKSTLEQHIASPIRVIGQVSNLNQRNHWYFSLKDDKAVVSCVAWASSVKKFGFTPSDGDEVVATGEISYYGPQGKTQLYVRRMEPVGAGALELQFRALCETLRGQGYFDPDHKIDLPVFPRRVAVITAAGGAAVHDVIDTAARRCRAVGLLVVNVKVQGDGAAEQIARAIRWIDRDRERLGVDAILVTRGGGSMEDLWAFNEQAVADATFACEVPIIAAIGHESDTTIIELVADMRAATPTQAAMQLIPDGKQMRQQIDHFEGRLNLLTHQLVDRWWRHVNVLAKSAVFARPTSIIAPQRQRIVEIGRHLRHAAAARISGARIRVERLAGRLGGGRDETVVAVRRERLRVLGERLDRATRVMIDRRPVVDQLGRRLGRATSVHVRQTRRAVEQLDRRLAAVDPYRVLARGYTLTRDRDGRLLRSAGETQRGQSLLTQFHDGEVRSIVDDEGAASSGRRAADSERAAGADRAARRQSRGSPGPDQMDLFGRVK